MGRPRVLPSPAVVLSAGSSVLRPDPPGSVPPRDFTFCAYTHGLAHCGCSGRGPNPSRLCSVVVLVKAPSAIRRTRIVCVRLSLPRFNSLHPHSPGSASSKVRLVRFERGVLRRGPVPLMLRPLALLASLSDPTKADADLFTRLATATSPPVESR